MPRPPAAPGFEDLSNPPAPTNLVGNLLGVDAKDAQDGDGAKAAPEPPQPEQDDHALVAAETLAHWLDDRFLDPLLGLLLPGVGDLLGSALGLYPVLLAWQRRAPKALIARMLLNLAADAAGGSIPILGDIWDFVFKAHARNLTLLRSRSEYRKFDRPNVQLTPGSASGCRNKLPRRWYR